MAAIAGSFIAAGAHAAEHYPTRPIRFVVPFAPGGPADIAARTVAVKATETLGQSMVIDNRAGGGGIVGAEIVARAKPDGHTILLCSTSVMVINPIVTPKVPYDPLRDLTPVSLVMSAPYLLLVHPAFPASSVLAALGAEAIGSSPEAFLSFVKAEIPRWAKAIRESGAKAQ